jgi:hypothetical protein
MKMNDELKRMRKEALMSYFRHFGYFGICLHELKKSRKPH